MNDDRRALAEAQARLVQSLAAGVAPPPGFDADRLALTARTLVNKRRRGVAKRWPRLAEISNFAARFAEYAATRPTPPGGSTADGSAYFAWLGTAATDPARVEQLVHLAGARGWAVARSTTGRLMIAVRLFGRVRFWRSV